MNWKGTLIWLSFVLISIFIIIIIGISQETLAYTPHEPIRIEGDKDFANQAASEGWEGNGTEADPYVIEGYEISIQWEFGSFNKAVDIQSTEVHFILKNSKIISDSLGHLIFFNGIRNGTIENCIIENGSLGIYLWASNGIKIINNTMLDNDLLISQSSDCNFTNNSFINGGFQFNGFEFDKWNTHKIVNTNTINKRPVYYINNRNGGSIPRDAGQIIMVNCTSFNIEDYVFSNTSSGVILGYSSHNIIQNNLIYNCSEAAVDLWHSSENNISNNQLFSCKMGLFFQHSDNNTIYLNEILEQSYGIYLFHSNSNYVYGNKVFNNTGMGIYVGSSSGHFPTHRNSIVNNSLFNNFFSGMEIENVEGIKVLGNNISNSWVGIKISSSNNGTIHHNNFFNNTTPLEMQDSSNTWRSSHLRGNYWSDYQGRDNTGDGIGDTNLPHQGVDYHPLMEPAQPGDYIEPDFIDEEDIPEPDDTAACILSIILFLIIIVILILILRRLGRRTDKEKGANEDENFEEEKSE